MVHVFEWVFFFDIFGMWFQMVHVFEWVLTLLGGGFKWCMSLSGFL